MPLFLQLVEASAVAMIVVILIAGTGVLCALYPRKPRRPMLAPNARRDLGDLCLQVLWPCLTVASIGSTIHVKQLGDVGELVLWSVLAISLPGGLSWGFSKLLGLDPLFAAAFTMAGAFGNAGALPMLMMDTLCEQPVVLRHLPSKELCVETTNAYFLVFAIAWIHL